MPDVRSVDEGDELKQAFRMDIGQVNDRQSFLLDAQGRVQGSLNIYNDPYAHSVAEPTSLIKTQSHAGVGG